MSATLVTPSYHEKIVEYTHVYEYEDEKGCGYSYDCDEHGNVPIKDNEHWLDNYAHCVRGIARNGVKIIDLGVRRDERTVFNPSVYRCQCGGRVYGDGDNKCKCGRWYNAGGQELDPHAMVCSVYANGFDCMCGENDE